jgi:hypothetical protein
MLVVILVIFKNVIHTLTAFKFACSILHAGPLRVVPSHVLIHVGIAPDSLLTIWTFVDARRTLDLQVNAICFLILVSASCPFIMGKDDILTISKWPGAGASQDGLIVHLELARHVHSYSLDLEW